ncbi:MAG: hypothetical protein AAFZ38_07935 [Myxococcota bacterium]
MIEGGWEFVWAAYGVTWTAFVVYGGYLFSRERGELPPGGTKSE